MTAEWSRACSTPSLGRSWRVTVVFEAPQTPPAAWQRIRKDLTPILRVCILLLKYGAKLTLAVPLLTIVPVVLKTGGSMFGDHLALSMVSGSGSPPGSCSSSSCTSAGTSSRPGESVSRSARRCSSLHGCAEGSAAQRVGRSANGNRWPVLARCRHPRRRLELAQRRVPSPTGPTASGYPRYAAGCGCAGHAGCGDHRLLRYPKRRRRHCGARRVISIWCTGRVCSMALPRENVGICWTVLLVVRSSTVTVLESCDRRPILTRVPPADNLSALLASVGVTNRVE